MPCKLRALSLSLSLSLTHSHTPQVVRTDRIENCNYKVIYHFNLAQCSFRDIPDTDGINENICVIFNMCNLTFFSVS